MQDNWDHILKIWGSGPLLPAFVNGIVSQVRLPISSCSHYINLHCIAHISSVTASPQPPRAIIRAYLRVDQWLLSYTLHMKFSSHEKAKEVEEFFASRRNPSIARTLKQCLERININANWIQDVQKDEHLAKAVEELARNNYFSFIFTYLYFVSPWSVFY
ncbi:hypothetical protein Droror1_Dr00009517 [Drosera rotundifolia]